MKMVDIEEENLQNFNEIFRKDVTYDRIKNKKKTELHLFSENDIFGETTVGDTLLLPPSPPAPPW